MDAQLRLDRVSFAYGAEPVLDQVDLGIESGEFVGIVGPSGSGKSTLLRVMLGTVAPSSGRLVRARGLRLGLVPQVERIDWNFPVTVRECIVMARATGWRTPWATRRERAEVDEVLERLGLAGLADRHIRRLSGGQQQRVFIARALFTGADVLLLDEPTSGLDVRTRHEVLHLLGELHGAGMSVVLTTHDLNGIATHLPRLVCLNRRIIGDGPPTEVLVPRVLEATYGSPLQVLEHGGLKVVVDTGLSAPRLDRAG